jgi:predicted ATP-binding protein involved in virulence
MRLDRIHIRNFRCFESATVEFSPGFNLFVGVNGAGKTSLLKAAAASLATPLNALGLGVNWLHGQEQNARLALLKLDGKVRYERCYPVRLEVEGEVAGQPRQWWLEESGPGSNQTKFEHTIFSALTGLAASIAQGGPGALPLLAFYTTERQWQLKGVGADAAVQQRESRLDGYRNWQDAALDVGGLETWVIAKSLERLESAAQGESGGKPDELELVNQAVALAVPGASGLRYDIKLRSLVLDWADGDPVPFDTLSDGQRGVTALIADMARRMALLNPQLGDQTLSQTPGVVLIDELDMHLHPAWQRRLPGVLKSIFPRVQFIAASHSPQMMGELLPEEIWLMRGSEVMGHPETALGLSSNEVLEELMGTESRNAEVAGALARIRHLIDDDLIQQARTLLAALQARIGDIPEVLELQAAIHSLEWLEDDGA